MGCFSYLYLANTESPLKPGELNEDSPYLLSKYHVPLFWLALFEPTDVRGIPTEDGEDIDPYLVRNRKRACALLESRGPWLVENFRGIKPLWLSQFRAVLEAPAFHYVHVDSSEVGSMMGTGEEWRSALEEMLGIFSVAPPEASPSGFFGRLFGGPMERSSWNVFNRMLGPAFNGDQGNEPWPYCGASGTDESMSWERDL